MTIENCKHEFMGPYVENRENSRGRIKSHSIWMCEVYGCGYKEDRKYVPIYYCEGRDPRKYDVIVDTADDIRLIRVISNQFEITPKQVLLALKCSDIENPIELQDKFFFFWTE